MRDTVGESNMFYARVQGLEQMFLSPDDDADGFVPPDAPEPLPLLDRCVQRRHEQWEKETQEYLKELRREAGLE